MMNKKNEKSTNNGKYPGSKQEHNDPDVRSKYGGVNIATVL